MSKQAKEKAKEQRAKMKAAKKSANYLRCGPMAGHVGKRQVKKARKHFRPGKARSEPFITERPGSKTRAKRRRKNSTKKTLLSMFPLRPLRKRRHLGCPSREARGL